VEVFAGLGLSVGLALSAVCGGELVCAAAFGGLLALPGLPALAEAGSDCDVVSRNFVSVSPVSNHPAVLKELCPLAPLYAAVAGRGMEKE